MTSKQKASHTTAWHEAQGYPIWTSTEKELTTLNHLPAIAKALQKCNTADTELPKLTPRTLVKNDFNLHSFQSEPSWNDVESEKLEFKSMQRFAVQKREQISRVLKHWIQLTKTQQAETPKTL